MIAFLTHLFLVALLFTGPASSERENSPPRKDVVAFVNVSVIPMDSERVLENQTVIVRGDRILVIGPTEEVSIPENAVLIDGAGKFLIPGLAEMHGHIPPPSSPDSEIERVLFLYVANGITTVRGMLGYPSQLELRERAKRGEILSPTLYLAGPSFNGNTVSSPAQAERRVRDQFAQGWDLLKIHPGLTRAEYDAVANTAKEVGIRFGGHVPVDVGLAHAIEMNQQTFDHLDGYVEHLEGDKGPVDESRLEEIVERTKAADAWVVPTMVLWETILGVADLDAMRAFPELRYVPSSTVESWINAFNNRVNKPGYDAGAAMNIAAARMRVLKALNDGGVRILMGTDAPQQFSVPGFSLHREIVRMIEAGMTPYEVLKSGTFNVGWYFEDKDEFGTIEVGKRADMILVDGNPLEDIRNVARRSGVMVRGRWLPETEIQERLDEIAASLGN